MKRGLGSSVTHALALLASRSARLGFGATDVVAALAWRRMPADRIRELFPRLSHRDVKRVAAHARNDELRNLVVMQTMWTRGLDPVRKLVEENEQLRTLRAPMILGTFHVGAIAAIGPALERVPGNVLVLRRTLPGHEKESRLKIESTDGDDQHRALVFHRALEWLGAGNIVFMPLDPEHAVRIDAPFLGGRLHLARGPFAMSRIKQVPIVPILARWRQSRVEIVVGDPIAPSEDENAMVAATAVWLERYLLDNPNEISARILELTS